MTDVHDKATRSYNMSRIKGKDTKPEMMVRKFLFSKGIRYKLNDRTLPGKPDLVFPKYRTVLFVHGCFWHGHEGCKYFVIPKTRAEFWINKIKRTKDRDKQNKMDLIKMKWNVRTIYECELIGLNKEKTLNSIYSLLTHQR